MGNLHYRPFARKLYWLLTIILLMVGLPPSNSLQAKGAASVQTQESSRTFPETGKTVRGRFLEYWNQNGGLARYGYPISAEMQQVSPTDGKVYVLQYFERSVFEAHPENKAPYDVLLQLAGAMAYERKYPEGAPNQQPDTEPGAMKVPETGKSLGGVFLDYWSKNGGLMSNGYPLSDEFQEVSELDGKPYRVQYFERAVFEHHPENQPPYNVLLSQLGTFRWQQTAASGPSQLPQAKLSQWKLRDPMDPGAPKLIEPGESGYHLKADWDVASVEFLYSWWGLGGNVMNYQRLERDESEYKNGEESVSQEKVRAFVSSLDHLHPVQTLVGHLAGFDNYPSWTVELEGEDGNHILVTSWSTGNPGSAPWNVMYNGRLYAQYDGSLAGPLGELFKSEEGQPLAGYYPGGEQPGLVSFGTDGYPAQLWYGFWGLLPFSDRFAYTVDADKSEITGYAEGTSRIGSMQIGSIDKLQSVEITLPDKTTSTCSIEKLPEGDPFTPVTAWKFTCPVKGIARGDRYDLPIKMLAGTDTGDSLEVKGNLWGVWGDEGSIIVMPPAEELILPIQAQRTISDLLTDHTLLWATYSGSLDPDRPANGVRNGEAILLGETEVDGKPVRYSIGTRFKLQDGTFVYWTLDRAALTQLVKDVVALPLTKRVLNAAPDAIISLWYASGTLPTRDRAGLETGFETYDVRINPCGAIPGGTFPNPQEPLRAFGYNSYSFGLYRDAFVLIGGKPVVKELDLSPFYETDPARLALVPKVFNTGSTRPFTRVWINTDPSFGDPRNPAGKTNGDIELTLWIPDDATPEEEALYQQIADTLPGTENPRPIGWHEREMLTFAVQDSGELEAVGCQR